jgi:hypothetical protein
MRETLNFVNFTPQESPSGTLQPGGRRARRCRRVRRGVTLV